MRGRVLAIWAIYFGQWWIASSPLFSFALRGLAFHIKFSLGAPVMSALASIRCP